MIPCREMLGVCRAGPDCSSLHTLTLPFILPPILHRPSPNLRRLELNGAKRGGGTVEGDRRRRVLAKGRNMQELSHSGSTAERANGQRVRAHLARPRRRAWPPSGLHPLAVRVPSMTRDSILLQLSLVGLINYHFAILSYIYSGYCQFDMLSFGTLSICYNQVTIKFVMLLLDYVL